MWGVLSTDLAGLKVPLLLKGLGVVGNHAAQQGALVVLLGGPQQLQSRLQQLEEVLQHEARHLDAFLSCLIGGSVGVACLCSGSTSWPQPGS